MTYFDSNDPREFGWDLSFRGFVPFVYRGFSFPQGVHPLVAGVFRTALDRIMAAGLTLPPLSMGVDAGMWGQEDRQTKSGGAISFHEYGLAIDVCAPWNPWQDADPAPSPYRLGDGTSALVEPLGLLWGGSPRWGSNRDRMHVENHNSPAELRALGAGPAGPPAPAPVPAGHHPFPLPIGYYYGPLSGPARSISGMAPTDGPWRPGLRLFQSLVKVTSDGYYGPITAAAARRAQQTHRLVQDGLIGPLTWSSVVP